MLLTKNEFQALVPMYLDLMVQDCLDFIAFDVVGDSIAISEKAYDYDFVLWDNGTVE